MSEHSTGATAEQVAHRVIRARVGRWFPDVTHLVCERTGFDDWGRFGLVLAAVHEDRGVTAHGEALDRLAASLELALRHLADANPLFGFDGEHLHVGDLIVTFLDPSSERLFDADEDELPSSLPRCGPPTEDPETLDELLEELDGAEQAALVERRRELVQAVADAARAEEPAVARFEVTVDVLECLPPTPIVDGVVDREGDELDVSWDDDDLPGLAELAELVGGSFHIEIDPDRTGRST